MKPLDPLPEKPDKKLYLRIIVNLLLTIGLLLLVIFLLPKVILFFLPFFIAIIISAIANPLVNFLEKRVKILRKHSSAVIIVVVLAVIFLLIYVAFYFLVREFQHLYRELPNIVETLNSFINELQLAIADTSVKLPASITNFISSLDQTIESGLTSLVKNITENFSISEAGSYVSGAANIILLTIVTILATYFMMIDRNRISSTLERIVPASVMEYYNMIAKSIKTAIGGYFKAQFKLMLIILAIMFISFELMGINYSFLIALGISILDFLPVFGTGAILGPWAVICFITRDYLTGVLLIIIYLACLLVKQLLQPKMVGDSVGIPALAALVFMFIGYRMNGVIGMIIGIPVGMILISFYRVGVFNRIFRGFAIIAKGINDFRKY